MVGGREARGNALVSIYQGSVSHTHVGLLQNCNIQRFYIKLDNVGVLDTIRNRKYKCLYFTILQSNKTKVRETQLL